MVHGFHNRLLHVDLGTGRHRWQETGADRLRAFLGGIGLGTSLLYDFAPPGVEPLAPENPLIFASAPLAGTGLTTTAKYAVVTKSPLTGFIADSLSSSFFALELKAVGVDAVVVTGRAAAPVYLFIDNRGVELRDARHLWGGSAADTETAVRAELGNPTARVASVGTAGENRVRFATISNEGRHAGRGGVGAVMGSKNLKAIALSGNARVSVADADGVAAIAATLRQRSLGEHTAKYREIGTVANLAVFDRLGALPTRNFQQSTFRRRRRPQRREPHREQLQPAARVRLLHHPLRKAVQVAVRERAAHGVRDALRPGSPVRHRRSRGGAGGRPAL